MLWVVLALLGLGIVGVVFVVGYALALRRRFTELGREAILLKSTVDELRAVVADSDRRPTD